MSRLPANHSCLTNRFRPFCMHGGLQHATAEPPTWRDVSTCKRGECARAATERAVLGVMGTSGMSARRLKMMVTISIMIWRLAWVSSSAGMAGVLWLHEVQVTILIRWGQITLGCRAGPGLAAS